MSLSTLFAFALVAACIIVLRYQPEENMSTASESGEVTGLLAGVAQNQIRYLSDSSTESQTTLRQLFVQRGRQPTVISGKIASWFTVFYGKPNFFLAHRKVGLPFVCKTVLFSMALSLSLSYTADNLARLETWALTLVGCLTTVLLLLLLGIHRLPQSPHQLAFKVCFFPHHFSLIVDH